ncbi:MAG: Divalent-cation tolerance protein CutA [Verrucomicrobiae bacterium]|nr:Divalent-cation tolerance protein CutA [Verrucomicrobiae bacterium]
MSRYVIGFVTCSSRAEARRLARAVLNAKLAACVNILSGIESRYWWQGKLERGEEFLLLIKTTRDQTKAIMQIIKANHSYDVPEIIFTPIAVGERRYLKWLASSVAALLLAVVPCRGDGFDTLVKQLGSTNDATRADAAEKIARVGGPRAEKQFRTMLEATSPERRQMAVVGLLQVSDAPEDLERVRARLKDESSIVRWSAAVALGQSGQSEAVPWLQEVAQNDANEEVREAAMEAATRLQSTIQWQRTLPRTSTKPMLVYFFVRGSDLCDRFEEGVLTDRQVAEASRAFVCVRLDVVKEEGQARRFDVRGAPTVLLLDERSQEIGRASGQVEKEKLLTTLADAQQNKMTIREARRLAQANPRDVAANWRVASTYLDEGREDLADRYLRNVIDADEANQHGHTDEAMFALGFAFGRAGKHAQAVYCMEQVLTRFPQFKDRDKAMYCLALSQLGLGQKEQGRATLAKLVGEFPDSAAGKAGKQTLGKLGDK